MMLHIFLFILILLLPAYSEAAYNIYLKNGSVIAGVSSYVKKGGELTIYIGGGIIAISEQDVLKIEETGAPEKDFRAKEIPEMEGEKMAPAEAPAEEPAAAEKRARVNVLKADLEAINSELKALEENEDKVKASIEEKRTSKTRFNPYQRYLIERDIEPLQQELSKIQDKKAELLQGRGLIEGELRALE